MEPVTALSLVCGIIQVLDFSTEALKKCRELYEHGYVAEYVDLEAISRHLSGLEVDIRKLENDHTHQISQTFSDGGLLELAKSCSVTANQLSEKLKTLKVGTVRRKQQAVIKVVRGLWEKKDIRILQKRLDSYQNALDTRILVDLRQRLNYNSLQQSQGFGGLDHKVQKVVASLAQGPKNFESLRILLQNESEKTREHLSREFENYQRHKDFEEYRQRILDSLWFDEIHSREENITEAHAKTFEWVFDYPDQAASPWDNFIHWLEHGQRVYWVTAKAGAGKSTLMVFLCQDHRTSRSLRIWSGNRDIFTPKFFFWSGGRSMAKSIEGLLRSLIWQLLSRFLHQDRLHLNFIAPKGTNEKNLHNLNAIAAWTKRRLRSVLSHLVQQITEFCKLCFFLDGLDELEGDQDELILLIEELVHNHNVKICLSSRPEQAFDRAFGSAARLRLHDLTSRDIRRFVSDKILSEARVGYDRGQMRAYRIIDALVDRADGVFLWVNLALKDQIRGLRNDDSIEQLEERLLALPGEVEGIYAHMLSRVDKPYQQEASRFLRLALDTSDSSLLAFALKFYEDIDRILTVHDELSKLKFLEWSRLVQKRITLTCAGMLEVHESGTLVMEREDQDDKIIALQMKVTVNWVHRTAIDFMRNHNQGGAFLDANPTPELHPKDPGYIFHLAYMRLLGFRRGTEFVKAHLEDLMSRLCRMEDISGMPQIELCNLLDRTMTELYRSCGGSVTDTHWCSKLIEKIPDPESISMAGADFSNFCETHTMVNTGTIRQTQPTSTWCSPDFLSFAASRGLSRYVMHMLDSQKDSLRSDAMNQLLCYSMLSISWSIRPCRLRVGALPLISDLLRRGGDPNIRAFLDSVWGQYLRCMDQIMFHPWTMGDEHPYNDGWQKALLQTAMVFVEHQAVVDRRWTIKATIDLRYHHIDLPRGNRWNTFKSRLCQMQVQLSTLAVLEACLGSLPDFPDLKKSCIARGARFYVHWDTVTLHSESESECTSCTYELSEQDPVALFDLWRRHEEHYMLDDRGRVDYVVQVLKFYDELQSGDRGRLIHGKVWPPPR